MRAGGMGAGLILIAATTSTLAPAGVAQCGATSADAVSPAPRVLEIEPMRAGELLACRVATSGLPGDAIAASMSSGLPSAIEMALDVLDARDRVVAGNRVTFRLAFDLWEETFRVEGAGEERDFATREELDLYLAKMPRLPVVPLARLDAAGLFRLRVGVLLHPLAPAESERLGGWIADDPVPQEDGREVLVSLGRVIRYFFDSSRDRTAKVAEATSAPFTRAAVLAAASGEPVAPRAPAP